MISYTSDIAYF